MKITIIFKAFLHKIQYFLKQNILNNLSKFIEKIYIIMKINTYSINRNNTLTFVILITLITTILIRLDFVIPVIRKFLSYELELSLRLTSALYSIISIFISILSIKYFTDLTIGKIKHKIEICNGTYNMYIFYLIYILMVNSILYFINYKSLLSLNIDYLVLIYFTLSSFSLIIGLLYIFYKYEFKLDLNKTLSLTGKICLFTVITIYISLFIGLRTGYLINFLENNSFLNKILCESTSDDILNGIKDPNQDKISSETKYDFSNAKDLLNNANVESVVGNSNSSLVVGQNNTISNVSITTPQTSTGTAENSSNISTTFKRTSEYVKDKGKTGCNKITIKDEFTTTLNKSSNNSSMSDFIKDVLGVFNDPLRNNNEAFYSTGNKRPDSFKTKADSFGTNSSEQKFFGKGSNSSLNNVNESLPSLYSQESAKRLPLKLETNFTKSTPVLSSPNFTKSSPVLSSNFLSPSTTAVTSSLSPTSNFNINKDLPQILIKENINEGNINGNIQANIYDNVQTRKSFIKKIRSMPFLRKPYSNKLITLLDYHWNLAGMEINKDNEIVLPHNIKNLSDIQLRLKILNESDKYNVAFNINKLFSYKSLNDDMSNSFWIEYDSNNKKIKVLYSLKKNYIMSILTLNLLELKINLNWLVI